MRQDGDLSNSLSLQCAVAHRLHRHGVFSETRCGNNSAAAVQVWLGITGFLLIPEDKDRTGALHLGALKVIKEAATRYLKEFTVWKNAGVCVSTLKEATLKNFISLNRYLQKNIFSGVILLTFETDHVHRSIIIFSNKYFI